MVEQHSQRCGGRAAVVWYVLPVALVLGLWSVYQLWPGFYLSWIIEARQREWMALEIATVVLAFSASGFLGAAALIRWRAERGQGAWWRAGCWPVAAVALASFFFAGEEISWGQTYLGWGTPALFRKTHGGGETNLHNADLLPIDVRAAANLFLVAVFFVVPALQHWLPKLLPASWRAVTPDAPAIWCVAVAFIWRVVKDGWQWRYSTEQLLAQPFYMEFVEQFNEHKELLVALGLLCYGVRLWRRVRVVAGASPS